MKLKSISIHPVAWRIAYVAVAKFGESGMENLKTGRDIMDSIETIVDMEEEHGDPYAKLGKRALEEMTRLGRVLPNKELRCTVDFQEKQVKYLEAAVRKMGDNVAPEAASPLFDIIDGINAATEVEYVPKK